MQECLSQQVQPALFISWHEVIAHVFICVRSCSPGNDEKLAACKNLGADVGINYKTEDFVARVKEETDGKGLLQF